MDEAAHALLARWANFYVIAGSSAGALTGLQFVVITLISEARAASSMTEIWAFGIPTVVHFCAALFISAIMTAPWDAIFDVGVCLSVFGAVGFSYALIVIRHAKRQTGYTADAGDWFWYVALPLIAYTALLAAGILLCLNMRSLFLIAATTLVFLFTGIHNAWDTVTYIALTRRQGLDNK